MKLQVAYTAPVEVVVDLDEGVVDRVVVVDEDVELVKDVDALAGDAAQVHTIDYEPVHDRDLCREALRIADGEWPGWEHGF